MGLSFHSEGGGAAPDLYEEVLAEKRTAMSKDLLRRLLTQFGSQLSDESFGVLNHQLVSGMKLVEIAGTMNASVSVVSAKLQIARKELVECARKHLISTFPSFQGKSSRGNGTKRNRLYVEQLAFHRYGQFLPEPEQTVLRLSTMEGHRPFEVAEIIHARSVNTVRRLIKSARELLAKAIEERSESAQSALPGTNAPAA